jgi:hypothetical protein
MHCQSKVDTLTSRTIVAMKLKSDAITSADLKEYLLSTDDFNFEREIYHVAKNLALNSVEHAGLYEDAVQSKQRRFDIRATHIVGHNTIELAIECKRLKPSYPLVASCVPRPDNEASHSYLYAFQRTKWAQSLASISEMVDRAVKQFLVRRPYVPKRAFLAALGEPTQEDETMYRNYA